MTTVALQVVVANSAWGAEFIQRNSIFIRKADMAGKMHEPMDMQVLPEKTTKKITVYIK